MALIVSTLQDDLLAAFQSMTDGDNSVFADKVSTAVKKYAESGMVTTTDAGAIAAWAFVGTGTGGVTCDATACKGMLLAACNAMNNMRQGGNAYLAEQMASAIHAMILAGQVKTDVIGQVTPPGSSPVPMSGKAVGTMTGVAASMATAFLAAFNNMDNMTSSGDDYMAGQMAQAIHAYLIASVVNTQGSAALLGSVGVGKIA
jgi:hypothetical protein